MGKADISHAAIKVHSETQEWIGEADAPSLEQIEALMWALAMDEELLKTLNQEVARKTRELKRAAVRGSDHRV